MVFRILRVPVVIRLGEQAKTSALSQHQKMAFIDIAVLTFRILGHVFIASVINNAQYAARPQHVINGVDMILRRIVVNHEAMGAEHEYHVRRAIGARPQLDPETHFG